MSDHVENVVLGIVTYALLGFTLGVRYPGIDPTPEKT
jgi:hypothetical protein